MIVSPSITTADFLHLSDEIAKINASGAPWVHLDVMDGNFVPNITFGPKIIADINGFTDLFLDVHLMVNEPSGLYADFVKAGADALTIHYEAVADPEKELKKIAQLGVKPGLSIKPATSVSEIEHLLPLCSLVLVMSVEPGFGGQKFMPEQLDKLRQLKKLKEENGLSYIIHIDGGISLSNIADVKEAGADAVVTGSAFFNASDQKEFVLQMSR